MARDYTKALKWIDQEIAGFEDSIERRTKAGLTIDGYAEELEAMKEIKEILMAAQITQSEFYNKLIELGREEQQAMAKETKKDGL